MVRLMHKKYSKFLMMKHSVLLFINLALVFYKNSIYIVYRAIHQLFVFSYKHYTSKKCHHYRKWKSTQEESKHTKKKKKKRTLEKVAGPKHGFLRKTKIQWKE